jgi:CubicO group peptidase (beta-lactamase class C family)
MKTTKTKDRHQRTVRVQTLAAATLCVALGQGAVWAGPNIDQRLDGVLESWVESERIVGATVLVLRDGETVYRRALGHADREAGLAAADDTIYRLASMTKAIVSATALALVDAGRLSLDDRVADWLPWFTPHLADGRQPDITIRQLMTHTSGLTYAFLEPTDSPWQALMGLEGLDNAPGTLEQAMRRVAAMPLVHEPGTAWRYSVSTDVLGAVIERASGMRLPDAVARYVTGPLGMTDTAFVAVDPARLAAAYRDGEDAAVRMDVAGDRVPIGETGVPFSPARATNPDAWPSGGGGMSGTAADYARFLEAIRTGGAPILTPASARLFTTHAIGDLRAWTEGEGWGHGLGAAVLVDPDAAATPQTAGTWQWGGVLGTHWFVDPAKELTVVVMTNTSVAGVIGAFPMEVRNAVYGNELLGN